MPDVPALPREVPLEPPSPPLLSQQSPEFGLPLEIRFVGLTLAFVLAALLAVVYLGVTTAAQAIEAEWKLRGQQAAEGLEEFCKWVILASAPEGVEPEETGLRGHFMREDLEKEIERLLKSSAGFTEIVVFGARGERGLDFVASARGVPARNPTDLDLQAFLEERTLTPINRVSSPRLLEIFHPIRGNDGLAGTIYLRMSLLKADETVDGMRAALIQGTIVVAVIIAVILFTYFHGTVSKPVRTLVSLVERIREGDLSARSHMHGTAEIGWLARNFDLMVKSIEASERENRALLKQVRDFNEVLQEQVRVATQRLQVTNEKVMRLQRDMARQERLASLGQLATTLAHEIGTPLNALSGHLELLRQDPSLSEGSRSRLTVMEAQVDRLTAIIRNVLQTMRMPEPQFEPIDVNQLVEDLLTFVTPTMRWKGIKLELLRHPDLPKVLADPQQLQQVIMNLVTNAIDVMPNGGQLTVSTGYVASGAGSIRDPVAIVRITDTGPGIAADQMARLFTPYFTTKALGLGSGLGLVISRQILRSHGGDISAESEPGKGTSFRLILPCRKTASDVGARGKTLPIDEVKLTQRS